LPHSHPWNMAASPRSMSFPWTETGCVSVPLAVALSRSSSLSWLHPRWIDRLILYSA